MNTSELYSQLADILDVDSVEADAVLRDFDAWDSLSVLSILAMVDTNFGVTVAPQDLAKASTAAELAKIIEEKIAARGS
jgi:acyl carrier protein